MEPTSHRGLHTSGIPRISKLPIPRTTAKYSSSNPTKSALEKGASPYKSALDAINITTLPKDDIGNVQYAATEIRTEETLADGSVNDVQPDPSVRSRTLPRRPRPSLSDRTMETLSQIPPSPSPRRRKSNFFPLGDPVGTPSRPTSSLSRTRPSTSHGHRPPLPSTNPTPRLPSPNKRLLEPTAGNRLPQNTPSKRAVSSYAPDSLNLPKSTLDHSVELTPSKSKPLPNNTNLARRGNDIAEPPRRPGRTIQTLAARPSKQRPSIQSIFAKPPPKSMDKLGAKSVGNTGKGSNTLSLKSNSSDSFSMACETYSHTSAESVGLAPIRSKAPNSSAALRETIAKAKAARLRSGRTQELEAALPTRMTDDFPEIDFGSSSTGLLRERVASARADGRLNIAAMGLKEIPYEVLNMYNSETIDAGDGAWYESVDLVRLVAADNELEHLGEDVFPDSGADATDAIYEDSQGMLFAGLDTLDLHGNSLQSLPLGLRRLERLTTLNLSKNKLDNDSLSVIAQIDSLRELRLSGNVLQGMLTPRLGNLKKLETLDISNNAITTLPSNSDELSNLRVLNVSGNKLSSLPFELLISLPLIEIDAARNRLSGNLFPINVSGLLHLKTLDVANNSLTSLTESGSIELPSLQSLDATENRLTRMPEMLACTELLTLIVAGNRLSSIPQSLTSLGKLKNVDLSRNDIKKVDERVGLMDSLVTLRIANNPLRERRFLTMDTDSIKRELRSRLLPEISPEDMRDGIMGHEGSDAIAVADTVTSKKWHINSEGVVDRSSANLEAIEHSDLEPLAQENRVRTLILHHNLFTMLPRAIEILGSSLRKLDLSCNKLTDSSCSKLSKLSLPNLGSLNLSNNAIASLFPLLDSFFAPQLSEIDVSRNRLTSLPVLRNSFHALASVYASQNSIAELRAESVKGLQVLDVSGNAIIYLEPQLGLLGSQGLRTLLVGANKFRVPRRDVVDKGTEAVLKWLRDRIPEEEMPEFG